MTRAYLRVWVYSICCSKIRNDGPDKVPPRPGSVQLGGSSPVGLVGDVQHQVRDREFDHTQQTDSTESDAD